MYFYPPFNLLYRKDEVFTISIIGRPNVGKSTLFNRLMGQKLALVDKTPGLTPQLFDVPIRLVDTAGYEDLYHPDQQMLLRRSLNKQMLEDMLKQTRNALIYSDLALFLMDSRDGINYNDVALYKWLNFHKMQLKSDFQAKAQYTKRAFQSDEEKGKEIREQEELYWKQTPEVHNKYESGLQFDQKQKIMDERQQEYKKQFKNLDNLFINNEVKIPPIIYLANKSENSFEGDILSDFYQMLPHASEPDLFDGKVIEPLFISAEHGDGLPSLYDQIRQHIPSSYYLQQKKIQQKRIERFNEYKQMLLDEIVEMKKEEIDQAEEENNDETMNDIQGFIESWEKEFDRLNPEPENNSDFDSDNDINPIDTLTSSGEYTSTKKQQINSENVMKRKPIQLAIIGRPNVGKSTFVNGLLKENRVIANDLPGTTRDCVMTQWVYGGRRIYLVDTAGIKPGKVVKTELEMMINEQVEKTINYSHIVIILIDSMEAFTNTDLMIINKVSEEGRGMVVAANKWDLVPDKYKKKAVRWMDKQIEKGLGQAKGVPVAYISAKTGLRVDRIMDEVMRVYEKWNTRVSTGLLNKWINAFQKVQKMPQEDGIHLKMRYLMQIKTRPPTFFLYVNRRSLISNNFERFMRNSIIKEFGLEGVPIRMLFRDNRSQYSVKGMSSLNQATRKVIERIKLQKKKNKNVTYRRRLAGSRFLYKK